MLLNGISNCSRHRTFVIVSISQLHSFLISLLAQGPRSSLPGRLLRPIPWPSAIQACCHEKIAEKMPKHDLNVIYIHPASRGVAAHTAGLFRSVRGAKGGVEYEEQSSTGELTYITAGFVNIFLIFTFPPRGGSPS